MSEVFNVHTGNEDGWNDYHEEDDETDSWDVALAWLGRNDCVWGEVRVNGKIVASKGSDGEIEFSDGWGLFGKKA